MVYVSMVSITLLKVSLSDGGLRENMSLQCRRSSLNNELMDDWLLSAC